MRLYRLKSVLLVMVLCLTLKMIFDTSGKQSNIYRLGHPEHIGQYDSAMYDEDIDHPQTFSKQKGSREAGSMVRVRNTNGELFLFTAFWDDRWSVASGPYIRVISAIQVDPETEDLPRHQRVTCHVTCVKDNQLIMRSHNGKRFKFGPVRRIDTVRYTRYYGRYVISCHPEHCKETDANLMVSLTLEKREFAWILHHSIPVEFPERPENPEDIIEVGTCHPVAYFYLDPARLVEWLELQKLLGVGKVVMYNHSLGESTSAVMRHYQREGYLDVHPSLNTTEGLLVIGQDILLRMGLCVTDCLYRNMYRFRYIIGIDADEVIVPRVASDLPDFIRFLRHEYGHQDGLVGNHVRRVTSYKFRNINFPADPGLGARADKRRPSLTHMLRYRRRMPVSRPRYHVKVIVDPMGCVAMYQHHCRKATEAYSVLEAEVDWQFGALHHYRGTMCNFRQTIALNCSDPSNKVKRDDIMLRYEEQLVPNVRSQWRTLHKEESSARKH